MTVNKNLKKIVRELMVLRGTSYGAALNELRKLPPDASWRAYINRIREQQANGTSLEPKDEDDPDLEAAEAAWNGY